MRRASQPRRHGWERRSPPPGAGLRAAVRAAATALPLLALAQCAAPLRHPLPAATSSAAEAFAPAPRLQALIDPRPEPGGRSWLGGDVALSVRLTDDHYVWLFGDTLLGSVSTACPPGRSYCDRRVAAEGGLIANSAGSMTRRLDGRFFPLAKSWRTSGDEPAPIFEAAAPGEFLWPLAAAPVGTRLLVAATRQRREVGLASLGGVFLLVENPEEAPRRWRYRRHPIPNEVPSAGLPPGGSALGWTTALVPRGGEIYVFGARGPPGESETVVARLRVEDVLRPGWVPRPEYLVDGADGRPAWSTRFEPERLHAVEGLPGTSEATIRRDALSGRWVSYRIPALSFEVHRFTAVRLVGPWRDEGVVYRVPPPWSASRSPRFAAYAVREHPELAAPGASVLSYNVNVAFGTLCQAIDAIEAIDDFYVPRLLAGSAASRQRAAPGTRAGRGDGLGGLGSLRSCAAGEGPNQWHGPGIAAMEARGGSGRSLPPPLLQAPPATAEESGDRPGGDAAVRPGTR